jgi:hypothetical protein
LAAALLAFSLLFAANATRAQSSRTAAMDEKESYAYLLTMDEITKSTNIGKALGEFLDHDLQASKRLETDKSFAKGTFSEQAKGLSQRHPELDAIIRREGMSTHEYFLCGYVLWHTLMFVMEKKNGEVHQYSDKNINPANIAFVEQHFDEVRQTFRNFRIKM